MKVKDLIRLLNEFDPETLVVMSKDAEGNGYSPLSAYCPGLYVPDSTYSGEFYSDEDLEEEPDYADMEDEEGAARCIVFWPTN